MSCLDKVPQIHKDNQGKKTSIEVPSMSIIIMRVNKSTFKMNTSFCQKEYEWMDG
jgi:hypothetical protein